MKKVLCVLAAVALVAVISTSCKKDCTCKSTDGTWSYTYTEEQLETYGLTCEDMKTVASYTSAVTCK